MNEKIESLLSQMTLEEKVALASGATFWTTVPLEHLGIPAIKVTDGPNGARGGSWNGDVTSACFPAGIALAATWNVDLVVEVGKALAEEARSKGAVVLLGPTVNIHRSPVNGRNFECYSEDPYLSARIAVAYITGLQANGVAACVKHFVCNDSEFERQTISSEVTERALHEIYLPPFKAAVQEAGTWSLMASYNKINGIYASENPHLLQEILKGVWGFDGLVMSDWYGTQSTVEAANGGLDLEMPGPARWMGDDLLKAVQDGRVDEAAIDDKVRRLLRLIARTGSFENPGADAERAVDNPQHRALLRKVAAEGIVLLKNDRDILPLDAAKIRKLAIIGPSAKVALIQGGGSAQVTPHYVVTPFEGIANCVGDALEVGYELGCLNIKNLPVMDAQQVQPAPGAIEQGLKAEFFNNLELAGDPVYTRTYRNLRVMWLGDIAPGIEPGNFSVRLSGVFTAPETGRYSLSLISTGLSRLFVDDQEVVDNWTNWQPGEEFFGFGSSEVRAPIEMIAGRTYRLRVDYSNQNTLLSALRVGCLLPLPANLLERAAQLAAESDVAVMFAGLGGEWESEGYDRPNIDLPPAQNELIATVANANPNTVVVLNTGAPVTMPWLENVKSVLQAWYPGQECGNAIADVLFGQANPSGKLPQTFPQRLEDNPAFINYPGENGKVYYGEGIFVGYRYYEKKKIAPLFPFGHGLSYTAFAYDKLAIQVDTSGASLLIQVTVDITNVGTRAGQEVVQLYIGDIKAKVARPEKELKAFAKIQLQPGKSQRVTFSLNRDALSYYDTAQKRWVAEPGTFEVLIGGSSANIRLREKFELTA